MHFVKNRQHLGRRVAAIELGFEVRVTFLQKLTGCSDGFWLFIVTTFSVDELKGMDSVVLKQANRFFS